MKKSKQLFTILCLGALLVIGLIGPVSGHTQNKENKGSSYPVTNGVYIELTEDFYRALREENLNGEKVYSNKMADEYLRQISVSTKFMVETNLHILRQQEKIIQLLQVTLANANKK